MNSESRVTIIDQVYLENQQLVDLLRRSKEISLLNVAESHFRKSLLLSIASFFETRIRDSILEFVRTKSNDCVEVISFVRNKAVERQYHTYFDWKTGRNANSFFSLFGVEFKDSLGTEIEKAEELKKGMQAFLALGNSRNLLVHENFANYYVEQSAEEIYELYQKALLFVEFIEKRLS